MKKYVLLIVSIFLISMYSVAGDKVRYKVKGLTDKAYYALCGTWSFWGPSYIKESSIVLLGWGEAMVGQDTLIIYFGTRTTSDSWYIPPAIVFVGDPPLKVLSAENIESNVYKLNVKGGKKKRKWSHLKY